MGKVIAFAGLTACAALAFPLAEMIIIAGLMGAISLAFRYSHFHSTFFKADTQITGKEVVFHSSVTSRAARENSR